MNKISLYIWLFLYLFIQNVLGEQSRQRRCIVIQKQSGTHGDSTEAEGEEDYRHPKPKVPKMDKIGYKPTGPKSPIDHGENGYDIEEFAPEFPKLRKLFDRLRRKKNSSQ